MGTTEGGSLESSELAADPSRLFYWECLSRPISVGRRFNSRVLISENYLWSDETEVAGAHESAYFLRLRYAGLVTDHTLPQRLRAARTRRPKTHSGSRLSVADLSPPSGTHSGVSSPRSLGIARVEHNANDSDSRPTTPNTEPERALSSPAPATRHSVPSQPSNTTPQATELGGCRSLRQRIEGELDHLCVPPFDPTIDSTTKRSRHFALSDPIEFRLRPVPKQTPTDSYRSIPLYGSIASFLPPSYTSSTITYEYILTVSLIRYDGEMNEGVDRYVTLFTTSYPLRVFASAKNFVPPSHILTENADFDPVSAFLIPSPAVYPPLPATYYSPSLLLWHRLLGGGVTDSQEPPMRLPLRAINEYSPNEIAEDLARADAGYDYIRWVMTCVTDHSINLADPVVSMQRNFGELGCGSDLVASFLSDEDILEANKVLTNEADQIFCTCLGGFEELVEQPLEPVVAAATWLQRAQSGLNRSTSQGDNYSSSSTEGARRQVEFAGFPHVFDPQIDLRKLQNLRALWWRKDDFDFEATPEMASELRCTAEVSDPSGRLSSPPIRVSIGKHFICEMTIEGASMLSAEDEKCIWPQLRDYTRPAREISWSHSTKLIVNSGEYLKLNFDFSESRATLVEIQTRLVAVETLTAPPLSVAETRQWVAFRDREGRRSIALRESASFSSMIGLSSNTDSTNVVMSSAATSAAPQDRQAKPHQPRTFVSQGREVLQRTVHSVLQHQTASVGVDIPSDLPAFFTTEMVTLHYELEVDFLCVSHDGELLELGGEKAQHLFTSKVTSPVSPQPKSPFSFSRMLKQSPSPSADRRLKAPGGGSPTAVSPPKSPSEIGTAAAPPVDNHRQPTAPFLVMNGPLLPKNALTATWSTALVVTNPKRKHELLPLVASQRSVTGKELRERMAALMRGVVGARFKLRRFNFDHLRSSS